MRVLAIDIGEVRCGIAVSDPRGSVASPVTVLPTRAVLENAPEFRRVLEDWEPDLLLSGLPKTMAGAEGKQAARIRAAAQKIAARAGLPLEFADERLSSREAKRILRAQGLTERDMRGKVDGVAASLFLQSWLDRQQSNESHTEGVRPW